MRYMTAEIRPVLSRVYPHLNGNMLEIKFTEHDTDAVDPLRLSEAGSYSSLTEAMQAVRDQFETACYDYRALNT